jgi:hypothetical protein
MRLRDVLLSAAILFSPCSEGATEQQLSPLATLQNETSGSILIQANQYDIYAITRAIIGYSSGTGCFHKDTALAKAWLKPLLALQAMDAFAVSALFIDLNENQLTKNLGRSLAHCGMTKNSTIADELERLNLFNAKSLCLDLENQKSNNIGWQNDYIIAIQVYDTIKQEINKISNTIRALRHRVATQDEQYLIEASRNIISLPIYSFYIATENELEIENQSLQASRLFSFINAQQTILQDKSASTSFSSLVSFVTSSAIDYIVLHDNKDKYIQLINDAHNGILPAMRTIGNYYQHGVSGFPYDAQLAQTWFQSAALEGDAQSILLMAISYFESGHTVPALAFVKIIADFEGADDNLKAIALQLKKVIESITDIEQIQQRAETIAIDFITRSEERMIWRLQSRQ